MVLPLDAASSRITQGDLFDHVSLPEGKFRVHEPETRKAAAKAPLLKQSKANRFLTVEQVAERYRVNKSTIWRWVANDDNFPRPVKLSSGTSRWLEVELLEFETSQSSKHPWRSARQANLEQERLRKTQRRDQIL